MSDTEPFSSLSKTGRGTARRVVEGHPSFAFGATSPQLCCREEIT
ncbi:hypothetical protein NYA22BAC_03219 [Parasphingorhabdus sp. NYA22]